MKNTQFLLITALLTFILTFLGCSKHSTPETGQTEAIQTEMAKFYPAVFNTMPEKKELVYNLDTRFIHKVTMEDLLSATSVADILPKETTDPIKQYGEMKLIILSGSDDFREDGNISKKGIGGEFNEAQRELLKTIDYSTNMVVAANYKIKNTYNDDLLDRYMTYHMTIIPAKQAEFAEGRDAFIQILKDKTKSQTYLIEEDKLQPGRVHFTVTSNGQIEDIRIASTSGYPSIDQTLVEIISNTSGQWIPASNAKGEKVSEELVFFFGQQGC